VKKVFLVQLVNEGNVASQVQMAPWDLKGGEEQMALMATMEIQDRRENWAHMDLMEQRAYLETLVFLDLQEKAEKKGHPDRLVPQVYLDSEEKMEMTDEKDGPAEQGMLVIRDILV